MKTNEDSMSGHLENKIRILEKKIRTLEKEARTTRFSQKLTRTLFDISNAVMTSDNLEELYPVIYRALNNLLALPNFYIAIYNKKKGTLKIPFFVDEYDAEVLYEKTFDVDMSLTGEVIKAKKPLFLTESMLMERAAENRIIGTPSKIWIGVPLIVRKTVIGVMAIQSYHDPDYFTPNDKDLLVSVSHQVALAIERKHNMDEINVLRNYLFNIIDSMPSILVGVNRQKQVTQWNLQAQEETGIPFEKALGRPVNQVFPRLARHLDRITQSIQAGQVKTSLKNTFSKNSQTRHEDIIIYPLVTNGVEGAVIRIDDVTEKVRLEEMMIQSEKMMSIGGLAAGMAHEINNPLAGMMQNAQLIYQRLAHDLPANTRVAEEMGIDMKTIQAYMEKRGILEKLETITKTGNRAARIITNMLNFARKSDDVFEPEDMAGLLMDTVELARSDYNLKKQYDFKKIDIVTEFDPDLPPVYCDRNKIQQVLLNLFKNAAQAMHDQADVTNPARLVLRLVSMEGGVKIEIEDNGPGMDEATRKHMFEPFFTTKDVGKGTGLGLSVSYFIIVNDHKGKMRVRANPGSGSTFIIELPLEQQQNKSCP